MAKQIKTALKNFVERTKKTAYNQGYDQGFADGYYEKALIEEVTKE